MAKQDLSYEQIIANLKNKVYSPVYFLMGEEPYYIDMIADYVQNNVLNKAEKEFDLNVVYGKDVEIIDVINLARSCPMMGNHQVVIVKEAQSIKKWEDIIHYCNNPVRNSILVFCYKYGTPDGRKKWVTTLAKMGVLYESKKLRDYEIAPWIVKYTKSNNVAIDDNAVVLLAEYLGSDLSKLVNELDKLILAKPSNIASINTALIESNIGISRNFNVFELQSALIQRDVVKANRIIRYFAENKKSNPLVLVLNQLFKFFSDLMVFHYLPDKSGGTVATELKINPYFVKDYQKAAQIYNARKTMYIIGCIRQTDAAYKGIDNPSTEEGDLMKELIFNILH